MEEDKNYISMIHGDLTRAAQMQNGMPENIGVMSIKTANRTILEASLPRPVRYGTVSGTRGTVLPLCGFQRGKSILAVQIADRIARTDNVLYLDFELSESSSSSAIPTSTESLTPFPKGCTGYRLTATPFWMPTLKGQSSAASNRWHSRPAAGSSSLTTLLTCCAMEKGDAAGRLMIQLNNLKRDTGFPSLSWHTPQSVHWTVPSRPTTLPEASGSTISLTACLSSGKAHWTEDSAMKQLKVRYGTFSYDADNVIVYEIEKTDAFLQFVFRGYSTEKEHLKKPGDNESGQRDCLILQLSQSGSQSGR